MEVILAGLEKMDADRRGVTVSDLIARLKAADDGSPDWVGEMRSAVEELCGKLDGRLLGFKFRHFRKRNFHGKLRGVAGEHWQHGNRWTVMAAAPPRPEPSPASPASTRPGAGDAGDDPAGGKSAPEPSAAVKVRREFCPDPIRGLGGSGKGGAR